MIEFLFTFLFHYHTGRFPEQYRHESETDREHRIQTIAQAQVDECTENPIPGWPFRACVALGSTTLQWESGLQLEVHDGTKTGPAGELCLFQLHRSVTEIPNAKYAVTVDEWRNTTGIDYDHTRNCVRLGMRVIRWHIFRCDIGYERGGWGTVARLYAEYHHPSVKCWAVMMPMSGRRAISYQYLLRKLPKE